MILRILLLFLAILPFDSSLHANLWDEFTGFFIHEKQEPPRIRVLILHDVEGANLEVQGKYSIYDPYTNNHISTRFIGKNRFLHTVSDGIKWGELFPGLYQIKIRPREASMRSFVDGHEYEGPLYIYDIGGTLSVVNEISIETYIRSILVAYDGQEIENETLAALAIIARTNAYFQATHPKNTYWAVDARKVGFTGIVSLSSNMEKAIQLTRNMIMSRTGIYEGIATPFIAQFESLAKGQSNTEVEISKLSLEEANALAQKGEHAAQILAKAFPGVTMMLLQYSK